MIPSINATECNKLIQGQKALLLDVRTADEVNMWSIDGALHQELSSLTEETLEAIGLGTDKKKRSIIVQCRSGGRSLQACEMMKEWGYTDVKNLEGGIKAWYQAGLPIHGVSEI